MEPVEMQTEYGPIYLPVNLATVDPYWWTNGDHLRVFGMNEFTPDEYVEVLPIDDFTRGNVYELIAADDPEYDMEYGEW